MGYSTEEIDNMVQRMYQQANDEVKQVLRQTDTNTLRAVAECCLDLTAMSAEMARDISNDVRGMFSDSASTPISAKNASALLTNAQIVQALTVQAQQASVQSVQVQQVNARPVQARQVNAQVVQAQQGSVQSVEAKRVSARPVQVRQASAIRVKPIQVDASESDASPFYSFINKILIRINEFLEGKMR